MSFSRGDLKTMEDSYAQLESPKMDFNTFLVVLCGFHIALLVDPGCHDGECYESYPIGVPFSIEVVETSSSEMSDIYDVISNYREKERDWDCENCEYDDLYQSSMDWEDWIPPEPSRVVVSSCPFTRDQIEVTMTSDRKISSEGHPNMVYLDDFESVYKKMKKRKEACPDIL